MSNSHSDEPKLLPGCWLESPWDPGTAGPISEQSHLIDLIPLYKAQWLRYFIFWAIIVGGTLALGVLVPPMLNAINLPVPDLIILGKTGLDRWLETILLLLTAGTSYLSWRIRRQKPECLTRGWILFFCVGIFLYMSLDRTSHVVPSLANFINAVLHTSLETNSVSLDPSNILYWETAVYGVVYLAVLSRLMIEFSGASMAQLFLLAATAAYACSSGIWFAPDSLKLPLTIEELSGALTLAGDFFLFWAMINYARFILLDGFGLDSEGWRIAINRYRYASRHSARRSSYMQTETETDSGYSSHSTDSSAGSDSSRENSPFAADDSGTQSQTVSSPFSQTISSVATTGIPSAETSYAPQTAAPSEQPFNSPYPQQPFGQQSIPPQPYSQTSYGQPQYGQQQSGGQTPYNAQVPYTQAPFGQPQYNQTSFDIQQNQCYGQNSYPPPPHLPQTTSNSTASNSSASGRTAPSSASSSTPTAQEVQQEFKKLEAKIHRQLTYDEKKAVVRRMIQERQGK